MEDYEEQNYSTENEGIQEQEPAAVEETTAAEPWEAPAQPQQEPSAYRGAGAGRKESPYANSPYVMNHQPQTDPWQQEQPRSEYRYQPQYEPPIKPKAKKKKSGLWKKLLTAAAVLVLVAGSCFITASVVNDRWEDRAGKLEQSFSRQLQDLQAQVDAMSPAATGNSVSGTVSVAKGYTAGQVYARNVQSVVLIESTVTSSYYGQTATGISAGSGFILTEDGYVVTNYHVVEGAAAVNVCLVDGAEYAAQVIGYDSTNDVALLKVDAAGLDPVTLGSSSDLIVGDQVVAIGNPLGELTSTLTVGYVSAKERDVSTDGTIINMLQTDCAINSGNSGGPLFNMKGEVVGITTAKYSGSSSSGASIEGIGFAIPIDDVIGILQQLKEYGYVKSAYMGVIVRNMDAETASIYGLPVGAYVDSVEEGGAAQLGGIQPKDIITAVDDHKVETITDLTKALRSYEPGDSAVITLYRSGQMIQTTVELQERPRNVDAAEGSDTQQGTMPEGDYEEWYEFFAPFFGRGNGG